MNGITIKKQKQMNNIDKRYKELLQDILDNGTEKGDRTGTGTLSVFGRQIRHNMKEGFPLLTTKTMAWKSVVTELIWFLRGDTNIKYLVDNGCNIWNGDAYKNYEKAFNEGKVGGISPMMKGVPDEILPKDLFIEMIKDCDELGSEEFAKEWGELGPIYGAQWRKWSKFIYDQYDRENKSYFKVEHVEQIDQIANAINDLKNNPDSRRIMVNAWNVSEIDDMVLPPCHYGFQFYTRELTENERGLLLQPYGLDPLTKEGRDKLWIDNNLPTRALSLMWNQRSVDTFLGLPFNIASYALLLEIIAKEVNMVPDEIIGNLGDVHLYKNHIEQAKEQIGEKLNPAQRFNHWFHINKPNRDVVEHYEKLSLIGRDIMLDESKVPHYTREPFKLPSVTISNKVINDIGDYNIEDFILNDYKSHDAIKAPLSN
jgi:thymidylate synthase